MRRKLDQARRFSKKSRRNLRRFAQRKSLLPNMKSNLKSSKFKRNKRSVKRSSRKCRVSLITVREKRRLKLRGKQSGKPLRKRQSSRRREMKLFTKMKLNL